MKGSEAVRADDGMASSSGFQHGHDLNMPLKAAGELPVEKVLVTPAADIATEAYVGIIVDRASKKAVFMVSPAGGIDIEGTQLGFTQLAAVTSGLISLAQGVASSFGAGPVRQTIVEMAGGYLFVTSISEGSMLAVFAERACDMGMIGYEMTLLAARVGHMLSPGRRAVGPVPPDRTMR